MGRFQFLQALIWLTNDNATSQLFWGEFSPETYLIFTLANFTFEKHDHRAPPIAKGGLRGQAPQPPPHVSSLPLVPVSLPRIIQEGHLLHHAPAALPALPPKIDHMCQSFSANPATFAIVSCSPPFLARIVVFGNYA
jgi:hypothetical protein